MVNLVTPFQTKAEEKILQLGYDGNYVEFEGFGKCLDVASGYWYKNLGHNNPDLILARNQETRTSHLWEGFTHQPAEELAKQLTNLTGFSQVCYGLSGSMANENALKATFLYHKVKGRTNKNLVVSLKGSYHGDTELLCHINGSRYDTFLPFRDISRKINPPLNGSEVQQKVGELSDLIKSEKLEDRLAAFIYEPVMGVRGAIELPREYLVKIGELAQRHDFLLIGDEIATGFCRTGKLFAYKHTGIKPDIMTLGKAMANGEIPLSATLFNEKVVESLELLQQDNPRERVYIFGNTLAGTPVACVTAQKVLEILKRDNYEEIVQEKGRYAMRRLIKLAELPAVNDVRGKGLLIAVESTNSKIAKKVQEEMRKNKIHLIPEGKMIMFVPPFTITEEEIDYFSSSLEQVLNQIKT